MNLEFYRDQYLFEIDRRDRLDQQVGTMVAGISGIFVAMVFIVKDIGEMGGRFNYPLQSAAVVAFSAVLALVAVSVFFLVRGFHGTRYKYIAFPDAISTYQKSLLGFHGGDASAASSAMSEYLVDQYVQFATHNGKVNDEKAKSYFRSRQFLAWSLLPFGIGGIVYVWILFFVHFQFGQ